MEEAYPCDPCGLHLGLHSEAESTRVWGPFEFRAEHVYCRGYGVCGVYINIEKPPRYTYFYIRIYAYIHVHT